MSIQSYIESLRAKPEHIRKRFAFLSSLGITVIIAAFWLGSFSSFNIGSNSAVTAAIQNVKTPAQSLTASVGSFFGDIRDLIFGAKKVEYSSVEVSPGKK
jgi:hypothetical protein